MRNIVAKFIILAVLLGMGNIVYGGVPVPFEMNSTIFNSSNVEKASGQDITYSDNYFRLGGESASIIKGPAWNWDDKYVIITLDGAPDRASFSSSCTSSDPTGGPFYLAESVDGSSWNTLWDNSFLLLSGGWQNPTGNVELNKNTRYLKFSYSYNFAGRIHNLVVTSCYYVNFYSDGSLIKKSRTVSCG